MRILGPALFPYTTLFRSMGGSLMRSAVLWGTFGSIAIFGAVNACSSDEQTSTGIGGSSGSSSDASGGKGGSTGGSGGKGGDRKSTRLNSSHLGISYAVFC